MDDYKSDRISYIDGLRAVAVLSVLVFHAAKYSAVASAPPSPMLSLVQSGAHGVDLFFVLSGFCLSYPVLRRLRNGTAVFDVARFAAKRIVRILPPYYAAIVVILIGTGGFAVGDVFRQVFFLDRSVHWLNGSFWTLAIEFRWYFIFPAALWLWTQSRRAFAAVVLIAPATVVLMNAAGADAVYLPGFMLGIAAAAISIEKNGVARFALPASIVLFVLAVLTNVQSWGYHASLMWQFEAFALVVCAGVNALVRRVLSLRVLVAIGGWSYGIYLVHEPLVAYLDTHLPIRATVPLLICAGVIALSAGVAFSMCAEAPFVRGKLRDRLVEIVERFVHEIISALRIGSRLQLGRAVQTLPEIPALLVLANRPAPDYHETQQSDRR